MTARSNSPTNVTHTEQPAETCSCQASEVTCGVWQRTTGARCHDALVEDSGPSPTLSASVINPENTHKYWFVNLYLRGTSSSGFTCCQRAEQTDTDAKTTNKHFPCSTNIRPA